MRKSQPSKQPLEKFLPAARVIEILGGYETVAKIVSRHPISVYRWTRSAKDGGTGGKIPQEHFGALIKAATKLGRRLGFNDLVQK